MAKAEATVTELVCKIEHGGLCLHSTWAKHADNAAPSGVEASTGIKWHQGLPPRGSLCGNGFRGDASTWPMQSRLVVPSEPGWHAARAGRERLIWTLR
jgi:hypothetical protein